MQGMEAATSGILQGIDPDHMPALVVLLGLPLLIWLFFKAARSLATGFGPASRFVGSYERASLLDRTAALLLLAAGSIHLALVPTHFHEQRGAASLFAIDGALLLVLSAAVFVWHNWRPAAAVLLAFSILAYLPFLISGREEPDQFGIATKVIELTALGLVLMRPYAAGSGRGRWLRWSGAAAGLLALTVFSGAVTWGVSMAPRGSGQGGNATGEAEPPHAGMAMQPVPDRPPTEAEQAAAAELLAQTRSAIAKYSDLSVAIADGYRAATPPQGATIHYVNRTYMRDGSVLDPSRPEALVYANTDRGSLLVGAMYMMPRPGMPGPDVGGPLTDWHTHQNVCFTSKGRIAGLLSPFGTCPAGSFNLPTAAMLHVWIVDNPDGVFAADLDPKFLLRLRRS